MWIEAKVRSPIGTIRMWGSEKGVHALDLPVHKASFAGRFPGAKAHPRWLPAERLAAYFDGELGAIDEIAIDPEGPEFYQKCWRTLRCVEPGETISYGALAKRIGNPGAVRAVGSANARNPIAIIVPCHRVVRAGGDIGNYGGGVEAKAWLLAHEQKFSQGV